MSENGKNEDKTRRAMDNTAESYQAEIENGPQKEFRVVVPSEPGPTGLRSGIEPLDRRVGGLQEGGIYLFAGPPGPEKLVAVLQFLHQGVISGERGLLLTGSQAEGVLDVARAWGCSLDDAWREGGLEILGFRDDFEMRVLRSTDPDDVLHELDRMASVDAKRIAVDPGSMFLSGGTRTLLGRAFVDWARSHPATVCATLSVDNASSLPSTAEWLLQVTDGVFQFDRRPDGFLQVRVNRSVPGSLGDEEAVTLQLRAGKGLIAPTGLPARRRSDRPAGEPDKLLLVTLSESGAPETETWARASFDTDVVSGALGAVARLQAGANYGGVLLQASRARIREATQACRAIRPMTGAALVVASDDPVRATDRVAILHAGADDCLSGVVDFTELGARIRQAVAAGGKAPPPLEVVETEPPKPAGGAVSMEVFAREVQERAANPERAIFSVVRIQLRNADATDLSDALARAVRDEDGDLVTWGSGGCLVLLQGARLEPARAFLARMGENLAGVSGPASRPETEILVHPNDWDRIRMIIGGADPFGRGGAGPSGPGGSGGQEA